MNCHASMPGPRRDRDWWDSPAPPRNRRAARTLVLVAVILAVVLVLGGVR